MYLGPVYIHCTNNEPDVKHFVASLLPYTIFAIVGERARGGGGDTGTELIWRVQCGSMPDSYILSLAGISVHRALHILHIKLKEQHWAQLISGVIA